MTISIAGLFGLNFFSVNDMRYTAMVTTNQGRDSHTRGIHAQGLKISLRALFLNISAEYTRDM